MKFRLRQIPVETLEVGQKTLVMGTTLPKQGEQGSFLQGPCVLECNDATYGKEGEWKPVPFELTK
jgi:hypothetical protein